MAPRTEANEREIHQDINAAIAGTEDEIFRDAMSEDLLDNDGDTELEDMGDGLEGDHLDEDDVTLEDPDEPTTDEDDGEVEDDQVEEDDDGQDDPDAQGDEEDDADDQQAQQRDGKGRFEGRVPPGRLREEAEQRRRTEQENQQLRSELAALNARLNDVNTRLNTPPAPQAQQKEAPKPPPDMFTDPEGYQQWVLEQAEQRAETRLNERLAERDRQQVEASNRRVDQSFHNASRSNRAFEFQPAFNALLTLDPKNPQHCATVQSIYGAQDPAQALFDWWDENGGEDFRAQIAEQMGFEAAPRRDPNRGQQRQQQRAPQRQAQREPSRQQQAPRYEYRGPKPMRSLNSASGSNSNRQSNPEMHDGSESSVFEYATRR